MREWWFLDPGDGLEYIEGPHHPGHTLISLTFTSWFKSSFFPSRITLLHNNNTQFYLSNQPQWSLPYNGCPMHFVFSLSWSGLLRITNNVLYIYCCCFCCCIEWVCKVAANNNIILPVHTQCIWQINSLESLGIMHLCYLYITHNSFIFAPSTIPTLVKMNIGLNHGKWLCPFSVSTVL